MEKKSNKFLILSIVVFLLTPAIIYFRTLRFDNIFDKAIFLFNSYDKDYGSCVPPLIIGIIPCLIIFLILLIFWTIKIFKKTRNAKPIDISEDTKLKINLIFIASSIFLLMDLRILSLLIID